MPQSRTHTHTHTRKQSHIHTEYLNTHTKPYGHNHPHTHTHTHRHLVSRKRLGRSSQSRRHVEGYSKQNSAEFRSIVGFVEHFGIAVSVVSVAAEDCWKETPTPRGGKKRKGKPPATAARFIRIRTETPTRNHHHHHSVHRLAFHNLTAAYIQTHTHTSTRARGVRSHGECGQGEVSDMEPSGGDHQVGNGVIGVIGRLL